MSDGLTDRRSEPDNRVHDPLFDATQTLTISDEIAKKVERCLMNTEILDDLRVSELKMIAGLVATEARKILKELRR